jgi:2-iminobutanoate/2-iminopropanoate deaminase
MSVQPSRRKVLTSLVAVGASSTVALAEQKTAPAGTLVGKKTYSRAPKPTPQIYSPAVSYGNLLFIAGKAAHGEVASEIRAETTYILDEIEKELINAGSSMAKVLKANVFLTHIDDYAAMNEIYTGRFGSEPPARTTVGSIIPRGGLVEIDVVAFI